MIPIMMLTIVMAVDYDVDGDDNDDDSNYDDGDDNYEDGDGGNDGYRL